MQTKTKPNIISFINNKGGVSKTTSCSSIASCMAELGYKVLVIDLDAQGNLSQILGIDTYSHTTYDCLVGDVTLDHAIIPTDYKFDIVPSNINLSNAESELNVRNGEYTLKDILDETKLDYDYVLIDCLPSLNSLTINALVASDSYIIPLEASILSVYGLKNLVKVARLVEEKFNKKLRNLGVFLAKVDARSTLPEEYQNQLKDIFGAKLFDTVIHQNTAIIRSQMERKPINFYNKSSKGYKEYIALTKEVINRG